MTCSCNSLRLFADSSSATLSRSKVRTRASSASVSLRMRASHLLWNSSIRSSMLRRSPRDASADGAIHAASFASNVWPTGPPSVCVPCVVQIGAAWAASALRSWTSNGAPPAASAKHVPKRGTRCNPRVWPISSWLNTSSGAMPHSGSNTDNENCFWLTLRNSRTNENTARSLRVTPPLWLATRGWPSSPAAPALALTTLSRWRDSINRKRSSDFNFVEMPVFCTAFATRACKARSTSSLACEAIGSNVQRNPAWCAIPGRGSGVLGRCTRMRQLVHPMR
mmetsp:Transcript_109954/g.317906  ORF Transcript_109954/g.317906 Transcript_109954/m.317906 type:complete len:280 (-) Transcript_109954:8-847(-)